jgi:hypothetical protein
MDIMHARRHADHLVAVERNREVMPRVRKELCRPSGIDRVVENSQRDVCEHRATTWAGQSDSHLFSPSSRNSRAALRFLIRRRIGLTGHNSFQAIK